MTIGRVPCDWRGETVAVIGNGPSLTQADVDACRGRVRVIAVKDAIRLAPWADALYSGEIKWWKHWGPQLGFAGAAYSCDPAAAKWCTVLRMTGIAGIETDPTGLRTGYNSGYQAINLAILYGARRILLLGFDMRDAANGATHWFGRHPYGTFPNPFQNFIRALTDAAPMIAALGVDVLNCSRETDLTCFPRLPLDAALPCATDA